MADITITAANVIPASTAKRRAGTFGETITAGLFVYEDLNDSNALKIATNAAESSAKVAGMAANGGADGQAGDIITEGDVTVGAVLEAGEAYMLSTAGKMAPIADTAENDYMTYLGIAKSTSVLALNIHSVAVQHPADA